MGWKKSLAISGLLLFSCTLNASGIRNLHAGGGEYGDDTYVVTYTDEAGAPPVLINVWAPVEARRTLPPPTKESAAGESLGGPLDDPNLATDDAVPWAPEEDVNHRDDIHKGKWADFGFPFRRIASKDSTPSANCYFHKVRYVGIEPYPVMKLNAGHAFTVVSPAEYEEEILDGQIYFGKMTKQAVYEKTAKSGQEFNTDTVAIYKNEGDNSDTIPYVVKVKTGDLAGKFLVFKNLKYTWKFETQTTKEDAIQRDENSEETASFAKWDPFKIKQVIHQHNNPFDPGVTLLELEEITRSGGMKQLEGARRADTTDIIAAKAAINEFRQPISYVLTYEQAEVTATITSEPSLSSGDMGGSFINSVGVAKIDMASATWISTTHDKSGVSDDEGNAVTGFAKIYVEDYEVPVLKSDAFSTGDTGESAAGVAKESIRGNSAGVLNEDIVLTSVDMSTIADVKTTFKWAIGKEDRYWVKVRSSDSIYNQVRSYCYRNDSCKDDEGDFYKCVFTYLPAVTTNGTKCGPYSGPLSDDDGVSKLNTSLQVWRELPMVPPGVVAQMSKPPIQWDSVLGSYCVGPIPLEEIAEERDGKAVIPRGKVIMPRHFSNGHPKWHAAPGETSESANDEAVDGESGATMTYENRPVGIEKANVKDQDIRFVVLAQDCCNNAVEAGGRFVVDDVSRPNIMVGIKKSAGEYEDGSSEKSYGVNNADKVTEGGEFGSGWHDNEENWTPDKYPTALNASPLVEDERVIFNIAAKDNNHASIQYVQYLLEGEGMPVVERTIPVNAEDSGYVRFPHVFRKVGNYTLQIRTQDLKGNKRSMLLNIPVEDSSMKMRRLERN